MGSPMVYSGDIVVDSLISNSWTMDWNDVFPAGRPIYFTFDVSTYFDSSRYGANPYTNVTGFNADWQTAARSILAEAGVLTGIDFVEVSTSAAADMHFAFSDTMSGPNVGGEAYGGAVGGIGSIYNDSFVTIQSAAAPFESNPREILTHEIGHSLGMGHPFDHPDHKLPANLDNMANSVMSYSAPLPPAGQSHFQEFDIRALYWIYGGDGLRGQYGYQSVNGPSFATTGTNGVDALLGTTGHDGIFGLDGNDTLRGSGGDDVLNGGLGRDTALYAGVQTQYTLSNLGLNGARVVNNVSGTDGKDTLQGIERLKFANGSVALDMGATEHGGETALLMGAVLGVASLTSRKDVVSAVIDLFDQGFTMQELSGAVMRLPIWNDLAGGTTSAQIGSYIIKNVIDTEPDASLVAWAVDLIDHQPQGAFLQFVAEHALNQTHVGLVGLAQTGLEFT